MGLTRNDDNALVVFKGWTGKVPPGETAEKPFGFCVKGISQPFSFEHYVSDFGDLDITFYTYSTSSTGYCGKFVVTNNSSEVYFVHPDYIHFQLPVATEITEALSGEFGHEEVT